jgi:hypothetical protein
MSVDGSALHQPKGGLLRRIVVIATALVAVLAIAVSAYAATGDFNTYTAKLTFVPNKAGSSKSPAPIAFTEHYVAGGTAGNRTAPLTDIKTTIYGVRSNAKSFPTCSKSKIANAKSDSGCPIGALIATGSITAIVGPTNDQAIGAPGTASCNPILHAWNGGPGKVVFFFVDKLPSHGCYNGLITTGTVGPFVGKVTVSGKNLIMDTPIPPSVSFPVSGLEGSLTSQTLHFLPLTKKVNGKTVAFNQSIGCKSGKRTYSVAFTANLNGQSQTDNVSASQKCG